jgi:hypothetical protein
VTHPNHSSWDETAHCRTASQHWVSAWDIPHGTQPNVGQIELHLVSWSCAWKHTYSGSDRLAAEKDNLSIRMTTGILVKVSSILREAPTTGDCTCPCQQQNLQRKCLLYRKPARWQDTIAPREWSCISDKGNLVRGMSRFTSVAVSPCACHQRSGTVKSSVVPIGGPGVSVNVLEGCPCCSVTSHFVNGAIQPEHS